MAIYDDDVRNAVEVLRKGGTILYPTDTIWGIGCNAADAKAVDKVFQVKNRPANKSVIILLAHEREVLPYVATLDFEVFDVVAKFNKPTTIVFDDAINLPDNVINADGSVAIRIVQDDFCRHIIKRLQHPLVSTSANISGEASPQNFTQVSNAVKTSVDYVVSYRQEDVEPKEPSAIIRWHNNSTYTIIRP